ncbi:MAG: ABC transporter ATP-binding protein [Bacteroidetes bacterium QS_9_68_14]|nr:MAG: ABC transporter ATP-binding protein [Bacteroidetes bacterium QS_9_68_14]
MRAFLNEIIEGLRIAGRAVRTHKMRSVLTTLGIIIGIAAVTSMATILSGISQQFEKTLSSLGTDVIYVSRFPASRGPGFEWWKYAGRPPISEDLVETIDARSEYAGAVAPLTNTNRRARRGDNVVEANVTGSTPAYGRIKGIELAAGRFLTRSDERSAKNVCVIGAKIAGELFPVASPVQKDVRVDGKTCTVVGVRERQGAGLFGQTSEDERIIFPYSTFKKLFGISRWRSIQVMAKIDQTGQMDRATGELTGIIRTARGQDPRAENNFTLIQQDTVRAQFASVKFAIYAVGLFLTGLALVVGGIGVMNIMYVSVRERTGEIGLRKAVGAKRRTILLQFLIEAVIICMIGGAVGVAVSFGLAGVISAFGIPSVLPMSTVALAFGICVAVGVLFGMAPAWQAAKAQPVEALRYE